MNNKYYQADFTLQGYFYSQTAYDLTTRNVREIKKEIQRRSGNKVRDIYNIKEQQ